MSAYVYGQESRRPRHLPLLPQPRIRRSFCRTWCDYWFFVGRNRTSCAVFNTLLFLSAVTLILLVSVGKTVDCPPLVGASAFCFILAMIGIILSCLCCCYHFVKDDDDLPFALFCCAYCLLVIFIATAVAGTVTVFIHYDTISKGFYHEQATLIQCHLTAVPFATLIITYVISISLVVISYCACIIAIGATSDDVY